MDWARNSWTPLLGGDLGSPEIRTNDSQNELYHEYNEISADSSDQKPSGLESHELSELSERRSTLSTAPLIQASSKNSLSKPSANRSFLNEIARRRRQFSGWKVGVIACAATASIVCLLNIILTIWAVTTHHVSGGLSYLYTGNCDEVARMSLWIHLAINAMSTLLLSASNYTMQIISSPTRKEVDAAHQKGKWLDIGVPSTRNLSGITWTRIAMWSILALSSVPLHLMYNTAVFSSLTANAYKYVVVKEGFLTSNTVYDKAEAHINMLHGEALNGTLKKYDPEACMTAYAKQFVSQVRNVLLITNDSSSADDYIATGTWRSYYAIPYAWVCGDDFSSSPYMDRTLVCTLARAKEIANNMKWTVHKQKIKYCMVEEVVEQCQLRFSLVIMIVVIIANLIKASVMFLTWWKFRTPTLVTIGDAVASFLDNPDPTTAGICLSTREDILKGRWKFPSAKRWVPKRHFWFKAASIKRWLTCNILCIGVIILGIVLLKIGTDPLGITTVAQMWELGFGTVHTNALIKAAPKSLLPCVIFANIPQAVLSFLYLTYNSLFSCVLTAREWSLFAHSRMTLRVTSPQAQQRSTYYLQLPYFYAIPLLVLSGLLHWLMSQSVFLALIDVYDELGHFDQTESISSAGYSCIAIFFSILVGSIAIVGGILNGFRRYTPDIPLVGSCSAAISAACHQTTEESSASLLPLQWGCTDSDTAGSIGHCAFSSLEVTPPVPGYFYAGRLTKQE